MNNTKNWPECLDRPAIVLLPVDAPLHYQPKTCRKWGRIWEFIRGFAKARGAAGFEVREICPPLDRRQALAACAGLWHLGELERLTPTNLKKKGPEPRYRVPCITFA